jgi:hypothetical protein
VAELTEAQISALRADPLNAALLVASELADRLERHEDLNNPDPELAGILAELEWLESYNADA